MSETANLGPGASRDTPQIFDVPNAVRNDVNQQGDGILVLRHFTIQAGTFSEFLDVSQNGVWPYFEKIGARIVGMWKVIRPDSMGDSIGSATDVDDVYLLTKYKSVDHWHATREWWKHGGNGPDGVSIHAALLRRRELVIDVEFTVLEANDAATGPYFLPGLAE